MGLIRLHANIHTLQGLQGYKQSKIQIEPAAEHCWWALGTPTPSCPEEEQQAVSTPLDMWRRLFWYTHGSGSFAFVPIVLPPFPLHCVLRMIGKHHHSLGARVLHHHLSVLVPWRVEMSVHAGLEEAHHCVTPANHSQQIQWLATSSKPDFWKSLCCYLPWFLSLSK